MEELLLNTFLAFDELDVVDQQDIRFPVATLERDLAVVTKTVDEVVGEFFGRDVLDPHAGEQSLCVVAGRMKKVRLAQARSSPDEQGVVRTRRRLRDRDGSGMSESVGRSDHKSVEGVLRIEAVAPDPEAEGVAGGFVKYDGHDS